MGTAIGQPGLQWEAFTNAQMRDNMVKNGVLAARANEVVDIYASINSGKLGESYRPHRPALGKVKLEEFARKFAVAF